MNVKKNFPCFPEILEHGNMKQDSHAKKKTKTKLKTNNHTLTSLITSCNIKKIKLDIIQYHSELKIYLLVLLLTFRWTYHNCH